MELQGLTPVSALYEFVGHSVGLRLGQYLLWGGYLLSFVVATAILRLYYLGAREGSFVDLGVYPVYVLILLFLAWPIDVALTAPQAPMAGAAGGSPFSAATGSQTLRVPRILAYLGAIMDRLQQALIDEVGQVAGASMHEWERISAINEKARLVRPENRLDLESYARYCYWPAMAQDSRPAGDPWDQVPLSGLAIDGYLSSQYLAQSWAARSRTGATLACSDLHTALSGAIGEELRTEPFHQASQGAIGAASGTSSAAQSAAAFYRRRVLYNELFLGGGGEMAAVRRALPAYGFLDGAGSIDLVHMATDLSAESASGWGTIRNVLVNLPTVVISGLSAASEWWNQRALGPATYYRVSAFGPYFYGMVIAVLLMLFPLAALLAFWPRGGMALVNYLKLFLSVKLWPILWSFLSGILAGRNVFTGASPSGFEGTLGGVGLFPVLASMYVIVPALSFTILNLAQHAGGSFLGGLLGGGAGVAIGAARSMALDLVSGTAAAVSGLATIGRSRSDSERLPS